MGVRPRRADSDGYMLSSASVGFGERHVPVVPLTAPLEFMVVHKDSGADKAEELFPERREPANALFGLRAVLVVVRRHGGEEYVPHELLLRLAREHGSSDGPSRGAAYHTEVFVGAALNQRPSHTNVIHTNRAASTEAESGLAERSPLLLKKGQLFLQTEDLGVHQRPEAGLHLLLELFNDKLGARCAPLVQVLLVYSKMVALEEPRQEELQVLEPACLSRSSKLLSGSLQELSLGKV
mmetsp:Transcript_29521/g.86076  ORF Transcript_29521/g.86076 Transcript_29521/m.86076 type:complete len:238 (-) Transcript_29521:587-1300(-)